MKHCYVDLFWLYVNVNFNSNGCLKSVLEHCMILCLSFTLLHFDHRLFFFTFCVFSYLTNKAVHLQALRKALFKPGAFFKGVVLPLCEVCQVFIVNDNNDVTKLQVVQCSVNRFA